MRGRFLISQIPYITVGHLRIPAMECQAMRLKSQSDWYTSRSDSYLQRTRSEYSICFRWALVPD